MELALAETLARDLMAKHGLTGWRFVWMRSKRTFGRCRYRNGGSIELSTILVGLNAEAEVRDTILHEIAHALVGSGYGHGPIWKRKAAEVGARPVRCYSESRVVAPPREPYRYEFVCREHGVVGKRRRPPRKPLACRICCRDKNHNRFSREYLLQCRRIGGLFGYGIPVRPAPTVPLAFPIAPPPAPAPGLAPGQIRAHKAWITRRANAAARAQARE